jgi:hypothetical protein
MTEFTLRAPTQNQCFFGLVRREAEVGFGWGVSIFFEYFGGVLIEGAVCWIESSQRRILV